MWINRFMKGSCAMYEDENCIMFAEINSTMKENRRPTGSIINGNEMWREKILIRFHWIIVVLFMKIKYMVIGMIDVSRRSQIVSIEILGVDFNSIWIKGHLGNSEATAQCFC